jgi:hypothetical protein
MAYSLPVVWSNTHNSCCRFASSAWL